MAQSLVQANCPKCRRLLKIDSTMLHGPVRCKYCGQAFRQVMPKAGAIMAATGAPIVPSVGEPTNGTQAASFELFASNDVASTETNGLELLERYHQRRKRRRLVNLGIAAGVLLLVGSVALVYRDEIRDWASPKLEQIATAIEKGPNESTPKRDATTAPPTAEKRDDEKKTPATPPAPIEKPIEKPTGKAKSDSPLLDDAPPEKTPRKPTRIRPAQRPDVKPLRIANYPGRALLIGVKNYLYANSLNPGYRPFSKDPLGLQSLQTSLIGDFGFAEGQVGELSDVAARAAAPPTKGTIEKTITSFLEGSRPQDRVLLVFMGHATVAVEHHTFWDESQACLVPIEADPAQAAGLIPLPWLYAQLEKCKARQKLLILDIAHYDPEHGMARAGGEKMTEPLAKAIAKVPEGVQVWVSCSPGEYSYQFASTGYFGSVFMDQLIRFSDMKIEENRSLLLKQPGFPDGSLPHALLAAAISQKVTERVKERANAVQTPRFYGNEGPVPEVVATTLAPSVTIAEATSGEKLADRQLVAGIIKELELAADPSAAINADALPPFFEKSLNSYEPDYKTQAEYDEKLKTSPLRAAVVAASKLMQKHDLAFSKSFKYPGDEARFKRELEKRQEDPATIEGELNDVQEKLDKAVKDRQTEPSKRWQAHLDFVYARLLAKKIYVREYNFVLGNKLKKDAPVIKNPKNNNGWVVVPAEKMQQKETREWEAKRQKLLDKLLLEHPGTPWEILARREKAAFLGLTIQEAKVD